MKDHKSFEKKTLFIAETLCQVYLRENLEHFENNLNVRIWIKYLNERQKSNTIRNATNEPTPNAPKRLKFKDARMSDLWNSRPSWYFQGLVFYLDLGFSLIATTCDLVSKMAYNLIFYRNTDFGQPTQIWKTRRWICMVSYFLKFEWRQFHQALVRLPDGNVE